MTRPFRQFVFAVALLLVLYAAPCRAEDDLGFGYVRRAGEIHFVGRGVTGAGPEGTRIDRPAQATIDGFRRVLSAPIVVCTSVDAASFEPLSEEYARDKDTVFYKWISPGRFLVIELPDADVETFEVLGFNLARDKDRVWWYGAAQPAVDASTVEVVLDGFVWKDAAQVWYQHQKIVGADPKTFRHLGSGYYADAGNVYWGTRSMPNADHATFAVLGDSFIAVDANAVYRSGAPLPGIDPGTCRLVLHDPYGYQVISDKNGVYVNGLAFLHADPATFEMVDAVRGRGGAYAFFVDRWHVTPVTVFRDADRLVAETVLYERETARPLATVRAEIRDGALTNVRLSPPPGQTDAGSVPSWQLEVFQRADLAKQLQSVGALLDEPDRTAP